MKKTLLLLGISALFVAGMSTFSGCKSKTQPAQEEEMEQTAPEKEMEAPDTAVADTTQMAEMHYQCPMKCEGDKTYDQPGKCPKCGMDLALVEEGEHVEHSEGMEHQ